MSSIPDEIWHEILVKVPAKSLSSACKFVCKTWFSLISNPDFIKMQLNYNIQRNKPNLLLKGDDERLSKKRDVFYSIDHDSSELLLLRKRFHEYAVEIDYPFKSLHYEVELMGSCHGILCLWFYRKGSFCLWNPATREYKELPKSHVNFSMFAFGYDYKINDYKVLTGSLGSLEVFSLGSNSWNTIENSTYEFHRFSKRSGVLVNGDFHWLARRKGSFRVIVSMDISSETLKELDVPREPSDKCSRGFRNLGVLDGCLCLFVVRKDVDVEIWVMRNYGVGESWTKRHTIYDVRNVTMDNSLRLMWSFKDGEILLGGSHAGLLLYFPEDDNKVIKANTTSLTHLYHEECYFESLVSLNSNTYVMGKKQIKGSKRTVAKRKLKNKEA